MDDGNMFSAERAEKVDTDLTDLAVRFQRVFASEDGQYVLAHLRRITLERVLAGDVSDGMLRYLEGQRYLMRYIERKSTGGQ